MYGLFEDEVLGVKWAWLKNYILEVATDQVNIFNYLTPSGLQDGYEPRWRAAVDGFFTNSQYAPAQYNGGPDFSIAGQPAAFIPFWKHAFAGPATYDGSAEVIIPDPYKEGESFLGWYRNADFSGEKVTSIPAGTEGDLTLYAKFGEYIYTCKEVWTLPAGTTTTTQGVVTYINGAVAYIQDATAGLEVTFFTAIPDGSIVAGDRITVGGKAAAGGKLIDAEIGEKESASLPTAQTLALSAVLADAAEQYTYELIALEGLKITAVNGNNLTLTDETNTIVLALETATGLPTGTKINLKAIALFDGTTHSLLGKAANVLAAPVPRPDTYAYPARTIGENTYSLTNKWLVSNVMDNFSANPIASGALMVRGMVAKNGKMYFPDRGLHQLTVVDGATGDRLPPIVLNDNLYFRYDTETELGKEAGTLRYNDIKRDAAGHILLGNCIASSAQPFQVWKVNEATGEGTLIVHEILGENPDLKPSDGQPEIRIDAFGVYGDVDGDGYIIAANSSAFYVYKWPIENGIVGEAELIVIDSGTEGTGLNGIDIASEASQAYPVDENYFYIDYFHSLATLIDMDGNVIDGFYDNGTLIDAATDAEGRKLKESGNGVLEFEFAGEYYLIVSATDGSSAPGYAYRLYRYANANREFKDMTPLWTFPEAGTGVASNGGRVVVSTVEVTADVATIYLYSAENGYGVYELRVGEGTGIKSPVAGSLSVSVSGKTLRFSENIAAAQVYNIAGQLAAKKTNTGEVSVAAAGIYVVKAITFTGETVVSKVIVK
jgi:uncharacterized repeat protein (TIGR02543 family)